MAHPEQPAPAVVAVVPVHTTGAAPAGRGDARDHLGDAHRRLLGALVAGLGGTEVAGSPSDTCLAFPDWSAALDAALALRSQLDRLPAELDRIEVACGLDLVLADGALAAAHRAIRIAGSADPGEIRLGADLAVIVAEDPPDRLVVRGGDGPADPTLISRLTTAAGWVPTNLVASATSFVGRNRDIDDVRRLLVDSPLVTIAGPPGTGKSRLAMEIAERVLGRYADGAWFVALAPVADPADVPSTVSVALGVAVGPGRTAAEAVADHLRGRQALLILDNFEHVMAAVPWVERLLAVAPRVRVLVTSRTPLRLAGERVENLAPFVSTAAAPLADRFAESDGVRLFAERAITAQPSFRLTAANAELVADICRRLDGLPLAIELAAARTKMLPLASILERLDDRLGLLTGGAASDAGPHESLRAAVAWSYDLLLPSARRLFRRLSVFRGGWSIEGSAAMTGTSGEPDGGSLDILASLLDVNVVTRTDAGPGGPRFTMLETLRAYAAERLDVAGEADEARRRHADHILELAIATQPQIMGPGQGPALDRLGEEHDNVRAALAWLIAADPVDALRLASAVWRFWQMRGHLAEGSRWVAAALEAAAESAPAISRATALGAAGGLAYWQGDLARTELFYEQAVALRRGIDDEVGLADALFDLAFVFDPALSPPPEDPERTAAGIRIAEEAHDRYDRAGHEPGIAKSEWLLGSIVAHRDLERARELLASSVERTRRLTDPFGLAWGLHSYGLVLLRGTDSEAATAAFHEALSLFAAAGDGSAIAILLDDFAEVARAEGDALREARLRGAAAGLHRSTEAELAVANAPWLVGDAVPRGLIDPAALDAAWAAGRALTQAAAIAYALRSEAAAVADPGLRVRALGPLIVDRSGDSMTDWGGPKAGSRHALAIFAFLMDRGERGVTKDEFVEVLWPDADVEQGDLNFHRTLGGLRSTLGRDAPSGAAATVIFSNGRYHLGGAVVSWLDVAEFQQRLLNAAEATDDLSAIRGLEAARRLYRGDYLDDCPLYGDSEYVEERRRFLRGRFVDALVDLGRRYEGRHDESLASARYREALSVSGGNCPSASDGLARLGVAAT